MGQKISCTVVSYRRGRHTRCIQFLRRKLSSPVAQTQYKNPPRDSSKNSIKSNRIIRYSLSNVSTDLFSNVLHGYGRTYLPKNTVKNCACVSASRTVSRVFRAHTSYKYSRSFAYARKIYYRLAQTNRFYLFNLFVHTGPDLDVAV